MATTRGGFPAARGPVSRSMTVDLEQGMTDGKMRKRDPDRGGPFPEPTTAANRTDLAYDLYGVQGRETEPYEATSRRPDAFAFMPRL